jgi:cation diffusion facilitator family transporter
MLSLLKLASGVLGKSSALISDGVNSLGDIFSYTAVAGGVAASDRKPDSNHQYGHDKIESIISVFLAIVILATGLGIGYSAVRRIVTSEEIPVPTLLPVIGATASIIVKLVLWRVAVTASRKTGLNAMRALATDHLSDALSSAGALAGVLGARMGYPLLDPIASMVIALLIIKSAVDVFLSSYNILMDASVDKQTRKALKEAINADPGVQRIDLLRTRSVGSGYWVEVEICCCRHLHLHEAHDIAERLHDRIEAEFPKVRHVMVHTNPCSGDAEFCVRCSLREERP